MSFIAEDVAQNHILQAKITFRNGDDDDDERIFLLSAIISCKRLASRPPDG